MKTIKGFAIASVLAIATTTYVGLTPRAEAKKQEEIRNVIVLIGDGMGPSYMTAYRYFKDDPKTKAKESTAFDPYLVGMQTTYPEDDHENITDSASAATAMSAGVKTYNNAVAVDNDHSEVKTVLEEAKAKGKSTGLVATSEITHATPAAFGAHDISRKNMDAIADDYYNELIQGKHKVDVLLGGGLTNFVRKDQNLVEKFKKDGYGYVTNRDELKRNQSKQVLGLFASGGMDKMIDRNANTPSLQEMTKSAIDRLNQNKKGFFLMVEGSQIDWAGHDNDIVGAMSEMQDFEKAFQTAIDFAKADKHTLVVTTADHSTGGLSVGANGEYNFHPEALRAAKKTPDYMAAQIASGKSVEKILDTYIDLDLTSSEIQSVKKASINKKGEDIDEAIEKIFNTRSYTGWTTDGHTGEEVPVYAFGPGKERFEGLIDNTKLADEIFFILGGQKGKK
ncbi:alkaline phosphatase [Thermoactinomyces sp. DSM 45891]|nr:alkaline phosphatase [Thermoactinomyces sp. DSM 45891]